MKAGIYVRISDDRTGQRAGVQRQEADCRELAERRGWSVVQVYEDNDLSAYRGQPRPAYQRLLEDIKQGRINAVVVWHLDRLHRHPKELEQFFEVCDAAGVADLASVTGDVDLSTTDGRFHARILGAMAHKESDDKSRRIRRKAEELAREGKVGGGGYRPFGYQQDRVAVRADEAELIREAAQRVLAGDGLNGIAKDWQGRGVETPTGRHWRSPTLKRMLLSPRIAGLRQLRGVVVGKAEWDQIIDPETHHRLTVILTDPARRKFYGGGGRRYLLTGFAYCGLCGAKLVARPRGDKRRCYVCASGPNFGGCGKIRVLSEPLEEFIAEAVFAALDTPKLTEAVRAQTDDGQLSALLETLRSDQDTLDQLAQDHYADRLISRSEYFAVRSALDQRIEATKSQLRRQESTTALADLPSGGDAVRAAWAENDLTWRRALVGTVIERVVLHPAVKGRNYFDPNRVELIWRF
ncbi:MAG: recombinase family protein [Acidobacteria bacterium]|nr:recombinase family protein [Acidobacteriota bacterium]